MVDPIDYTAGLDRSIANGARLGGLMGVANQQALENQKAAEAHALAKQFQTDWQGSFGDPQKMTALAAKYPGQMEAIKAGIGFQDEQHQAALGSAARDLRIAMATNNPQAVQQAAVRHAGVLGTVGSSPDDIVQQFQQDPNSLAHTVDAVGMSALGAKDYYGVENDRTQRQQDQQRLDETARQNRESNAVQWANSGIAQQNVNIRKMELADKRFDRQIANETNALKLADLQDKRQLNQQKIEQTQRDKADSYHQANDTFTQTIATANKVLNSPGFDNYFGLSMTKLPVVGALPGTDAADTEALVNTLSSQGFLTSIQQMKGMGALSDAEGKKISSAIASLDSKQSDKSAKESIKTIIGVTEAAQRRLQKRFGGDILPKQQEQQEQQNQDARQQPEQQQQAPAAAIQALKNNPQMAGQFQAKYGYLPQGFE